MRQELAFARKLPDAESLRQDIEQQLTLVPNNWTDGALRRNREEGEFELAHQLNVPEWLVKVAHTVRKNRRIRE